MVALRLRTKAFFIAILLGAAGCPSPALPPPPPNKPPAITSSAASAASVKPEIDEPATPPLVYQDSNGTLQLSPIVAQLVGKGLVLDEVGHIRGFRNRQQRARWQVQITVSGSYRVEAKTICTGPTREAQLRVHVGENRFVEEFAGLSENSEQIVTTPLGVLDLQGPNRYRVELEMTGLPLVGEFAVAEIRLIPQEDLPSAVPRFTIETTEQDGS